jgi:dCMP deaminase
MSRLSKDNFYMSLAYDYAGQTTCLRRAVGAVVVLDDMQVGGGYNGAVRNHPHCKTCMREEINIPSGQRLEYCVGAHAEINAILQAKRDLKGGTLYCTTYPCTYCAKAIVQAQIARVVYKEGYASELTALILQNVQVDRLE